MKRIFAIFITVTICLLILTLGVGATEIDPTDTTEAITEAIESTEAASVTETEAVTEAETETESGTDEVIAGIVEDVEAGRMTAKEAILKIAEVAGIDREQAEELIGSAIELGDAYLKDMPIWERMKASISENLEFWIAVLVAGSAIIAIVGGALMLVIKVARPIERVDYNTESTLKDSAENKKAISQTLANLLEKMQVTLDEDAKMKRELAERDTRHQENEEKLEAVLAENAELKRGMIDSEMYIMQILKLIYSRTDLTLTDKSVLDLWMAKAEASLKDKMTAEDILRHKELQGILKGERDNG